MDLTEHTVESRTLFEGHIVKLTLDRARLPDGTLAEWAHSHPAADSQHRHTSHLLGVFPYAQITPEGTPELAEAAWKSMESRLCPEDNWEDTGWARSLLLLYSARLRRKEAVSHHLRSMQKELTHPGHASAHKRRRFFYGGL